MHIDQVPILLKNVLSLCLMICFCQSYHALAQDNTKPNVVIIFADDLGYGDLGCYGATKQKTPNIDRIANEGRRFTDAHSASAVCTPSRYALLTGEYPFRANEGKGVWGPLRRSAKSSLGRVESLDSSAAPQIAGVA